MDGMFGVIVIFWLILCVVVGCVAQSIGRSFSVYTILSVFLSPLIGFIILAIKGKATQEEQLNNKKHIYYCPSCDATYSSFGGKTEFCPDCEIKLTETMVLANDWREYNTERKEDLKKEFLRGKLVLNNAAMQQTTKTVSNEEIGTADEIKKYKELLDMGAITQEEFDIKKKQLLNLRGKC